MQTSNILFILSLLIACSYSLRTLSTLESTLNAKTEEHMEAETEEHMEAETEESLEAETEEHLEAENEEHMEAEAEEHLEEEDKEGDTKEAAHETGLQVPEALKEDLLKKTL